MRDFDLIVIGSGPAASTVARTCKKQGLSVAMAERRAYGGTCALAGCNPKRVLVRAAQLADWNRRMQSVFLDGEAPGVDWPRLLEFKRRFTEPVTPGTLKSLDKAGIARLAGHAEFISPDRLRVGDNEYSAKHYLIGTGAMPVPLEIPGSEYVIDSDQFLELAELPDQVCFIGGGYIAMEFAQVVAHCGSQVTIIDRGELPLAPFDREHVQRLAEYMRTLGIEIQTSTEVRAVHKLADGKLRVVGQRGDEEVEHHADLVVHGAGRVPRLAGLGLEVADVDYDDRGVTVNPYLHSVSNERVYAAGDAAAGGAPPLTPAANLEGRIAALNILEGDEHRANYAGLPEVVFTIPEVAAVGLHEADAKKRGLAYEVHQGDMSEWSEVRKLGEIPAAYKVIVDKQTDRILGAHLLGPDAGETINYFGLAIRYGLTATQLKDAPLAFPTMSHGIRNMI